MKLKNLIVASTVGLTGLIGLSSSTYTVSEGQHAVVENFGQAKRIVLNVRQPGVNNPANITDSEAKAHYEEIRAKYEPKGIDVDVGAGLYFKLPLVDSVTYQDARSLSHEIATREVPTMDKKKLVTDFFTRWRIWDPLQFKLTANNEQGMVSRLDDLVYSHANVVTGRNNAVEMIRSDNAILEQYPDVHLEPVQRGREAVMDEITQLSDATAKEKYGIRVDDVRMIRADLPNANKASVFERMQAERQRISTRFTSEGDSIYTQMTASTERRREEILAEAYKKAEGIKGAADAQATRIYAEAYSQDPEFFQFWRTMEAYKAGTLKGSKVVLGGDSTFLKYLQGPSGK